MSTLATWLAEGAPLLADGAMGTMLLAAGLRLGEPAEGWNLHPTKRAQVLATHHAYAQAGAKLLLTNTLGANPFRLQQTGLADQLHAINQAGVELARRAAPAALIAGVLGPTGAQWAPTGGLTLDRVRAGFAAQAAALAHGGVDLLWIETMSDLPELDAAVAGARESAPRLPIVATLTFDSQGHTATRVPVEAATHHLARLGLAAFGANCGTGPADMEAILARMHAVCPTVPLVAKSNLGLPTMIEGQAHYTLTPADMGVHARRVRACGATIIGACCGSTPAHIGAMQAALTSPSDHPGA